jgi:pimeloyl-ACP methyl ester carboxylesterase
VVIVHGAPDRSKNFAHVVHLLGDLPVTVYDRRGYGRSLAAAGADGAAPGGFPVHADDLVAVLGGTRSIVVGQSAGGAIALRAAQQAPELFAAVGVWEPPMVPWDWWMGEEAWQRTMLWALYADPDQLGEHVNRSILGAERWAGLLDRTRDLLRAEGSAFRADMLSQRAPFLDVDRGFDMPVVVGCGTVAPDPRFVDAHRRVADRLGAERLVVDGADHYAHTNHPGAWVALVRRTVALAHLGADCQ